MNDYDRYKKEAGVTVHSAPRALVAVLSFLLTSPLQSHRALYRLPGYPDSLEAQLTRASLRAAGQSEQRRVVVSHTSALYYYGLQAQKPEQTDLTVSAVGLRGQEPGCRLHHGTETL